MRNYLRNKIIVSILTALLVMLTAVTGAFADTPLKISVLCDDKAAAEGFATEHGVSIFIELPNGHHWLLDTGTTNIYLENAEHMGISLDNLSGIAISHGHDDHTGGLTFYPSLKGAPPVYGHPYIWHKQYGVKKNAPVRICGMPYLARKYTQATFKPVNNVTKLDEGFYFFTDVPRETDSYQPIQGKFFNEDGTGPCPIIDDATLAIKTPEGIVAIFGCGHAGYINILKAIKKKFPNEKILSVVGGLHLKKASPEVLKKAVAYTDTVKAKGFTFYGGHCTGENAIAHFRKVYGDKVVKPLGAGRVIEY
ncbi:MBL fold metallo-hydrolase [Desulfoluna spongiiphila]|uniref:7,8-dihydropterin-6-yl-methyl-4-(Beta-D-ribofuranosyl)aminobenzene 5'-phosphate synthase n=1 Tax=Desulfoluna spongiiphila TaxID=419481 RepID=A0A1G5HK67_9BACT|nr:MBL fold metallo-hydrolase [Desulfoluna spongiiphila]SCY64265.1 7,8-dihydropterin-6-yl-methyl-4-(beta-D-ribofuranosyl)aminobenzene 5'-phosphate synthase [Desulfoluna spongiiphila]